MVAGGRAVNGLAHSVDALALEKQSLRQGCLPAGSMPRESDVAYVFAFVSLHLADSFRFF
jgi:hypothetical protein